MIFCVGVNHKTANIAVRESLFIDSTQIGLIIAKLAQDYQLPEVVILSTCNRLEIFATTNSASPVEHSTAVSAFEYLYKIYQEFSERHLDFTHLRKQIYVATGETAVEHIFKVAAGMESIVIGETQIAGQFKIAFQQSLDLNLVGPVLSRVFQDAVFYAKRVRSETPIGKKVVSVGHCAVDLTRQIMGEVSALNYLVLGAGEMAGTLCKHLTKYKPQSLTVLSPDGVSAKRLCGDLNFGVGLAMTSLAAELVHADCVISATRAQEYLITFELAEKAAAGRLGRPTMFVDISLPRNIDPALTGLTDVYVFDIDDLKQIVDENYKSREEALVSGNAIISEGITNYRERQKVSVIAPVLSQINIYFSKLIDKEFDRTFSKNIFTNLEVEQKEAVENLKNSLASKLTADFTQNMKKYSAQIPDLLDFMQLLFQNEPSKEKRQEKHD